MNMARYSTWGWVMTLLAPITCSAAKIGPPEIPVMEQVFRVEVAQPPSVETRLEVPAGVVLLDRTPADRGGEVTRFYFRAARPLNGAELVFHPLQRPPLRLPLTVHSYREDIEAHLAAVPGIDPRERKPGRTYYTAEMIAVARANLEAYPELADQLSCTEDLLSMEAEALWRSLPSWNIPRQCYSNWPCPTCGETIFARSGFYPWQRTETPFVCACPECGETFPSNAFADDDFTSGDYPDDGWGYDPGSGKPEDRAGWVAHWNHHSTWRSLGGTLRRLSLAWLLDGNRQAAHQAAVLLARMAYVYPGMNMRWQQVKPGYSRPGRLLLDGNWERNEILIPALHAYDAIHDAIGEDLELLAFLQAKDETLETPDDVRALLDVCLVQLFGWDWMRRELSGGNQGAREEDLAQMIVCAGMPQATDAWLQELFTHAYNSGSNAGGFDDESYINNLSREGLTLVAGLGYALGYVRSKSDMAEILARITHPRWRDRCNLYDPSLYPKFRAEFDAWPRLICAGQFGPSYGDSGGARAVRYPRGIGTTLRLPYERAYARWGTDRMARVLDRAGKGQVSLFERDVWPDVRAHVERLPEAAPLRSRVLDGNGFAILESRADAADLAARAAVAVRYGYAVGHHHQDNLNIEFWAHNDVVTPELGYPCWAHPMGNTSFVAHHNTGMIDRKGQYRGATGKGVLECFAPAAEASFVEVSAAPDGFPNRVYQRALCLADAPQGNVYLFDVFRLAGGRIRTFCAHGPAGDSFTSSLTFGEVQPGSWDAGPVGRGLKTNIVDVQTVSTDEPFWLDWAADSGAFHLRLHLLPAPGRRYLTGRCAKTDIPPIRYLFAEEEADDGASQFVAIWEPYTEAPFIERIETLQVSGAPATEFAPVVLRLTLRDGRVDTLLYNPDRGEVTPTSNAWRTDARFLYLSEDTGEMRLAHAAECALLEDIGAPPPLAAYQGRVTQMDWDTRRADLDVPLPGNVDWTGRVVHFRYGPHRSAYHVEKVLDDGRAILLDLDGLIYRGTITGASPGDPAVAVEVAPRIPGSGGETPHSYYEGAWAVSEDGRDSYRVRGHNGARFELDRPLDESAFADADGDGRRRIALYDVGPGDAVRIPWSSTWRP